MTWIDELKKTREGRVAMSAEHEIWKLEHRLTRFLYSAETDEPALDFRELERKHGLKAKSIRKFLADGGGLTVRQFFELVCDLEEGD